MKVGNRVNVLLVELLIVVFFFLLGSVVLVQIFGKAHSMSAEAGAGAEALAEAQNLADLISAADIGEILEKQGYLPDESGTWSKDFDRFRIEAGREEEQSDHGTIERVSIRAIYGDKVLVTLPCVKYLGRADTASVPPEEENETGK